MVSKLRFKGDPKSKVGKKKKKSHHTVEPRSTARQLTLEDVETSWTTSSSLEDSHGPVMLCLLNENNNVKIVTWDDEGLCTLSEGFGVNENDQLTPWKSLIHTVEPLSSAQVLICSSVPDSRNITLRASRGKYMGKTGDKISFDHDAIDKNCLFKADFQDDGFITLTIGDESLVASPNDELQLSGSQQATRFVLRVQMRNTSRGKRMIEELSGMRQVSNGDDGAKVDEAIQSLLRYNVELTDELVERLQHANSRGHLNEQLVEERAKLKSDSRC